MGVRMPEEGANMPRPEFSARPGRTVKKGGISGWLQGRKEHKEALAEKAAKMVSDDTAKNETTIINTLSSIDFINSKLPDNVLNKKSNPKRGCGDLEYASKYICKRLSNPQILAVDMRRLDEKLIAIANLFAEAVKNGDARAACAAKVAMLRGVDDIRTKVPSNNPELFNQFIEANANYLDGWITLIEYAQKADEIESNVKDHEKDLKEFEEQREKKINELKEELQENDAIAEAFAGIVSHDSPEERAKWTKEQRDVHKRMVDRRMAEVRLQLNRLMLQQEQQTLSETISKMELLNAKLISLPIAEDPNLMNKFREQVDQLFDEIAASDAELDESLRLMDDIEGRIAQMDSAPGAVRAREVAAEEGQKALEEIKKMQDVNTGEQARRVEESRRSLGILSKEAEAELRRQAEANEQRLMAEMQDKAFDTNEEEQDESSLLYN